MKDDKKSEGWLAPMWLDIAVYVGTLLSLAGLAFCMHSGAISIM